MRSFLLRGVLLGLLLVRPAAAEELVLEGLKPSTVYFLRVQLLPSGVASVQQLTSAQVGDFGAPPDLPEDPIELGPLAAKAAKFSREVVGDPDRAGTSLALAVVYLKVSQANTSDPMRTIKVTTDAVLRLRDATDAWRPFRDEISALVAKRLQEGTWEPERDLQQIAVGLKAAGDNPQAVLDLKLILEIIRLVLELLGNR